MCPMALTTHFCDVHVHVERDVHVHVERDVHAERAAKPPQCREDGTRMS